MSRVAFSQAVAKRRLLSAIDAMAERGLVPKAVHIAVDGGMTLLTEVSADLLPSANENAEWVTLAGQTALPRA